MNKQTLDSIQSAYEWTDAVITPVQSGLINATWKVSAGSGLYVLQRINTKIFRHPEWIDENLRMVAAYLQQVNPGYLFTAPVITKNANGLVQMGDDCYRVFEWIKDSHTLDVVQNTEQAREAATQFGLFTAMLGGFDANRLHITLPDFHNPNLRYQQFEKSLQNGNAKRMPAAADTIRYLQSQVPILDRYNVFIRHPEAGIRVTHHDTKISNVLFGPEGKGLCVIDLDTVMPGYFLSDAGDMFRTYVCPVSEEESNLDRICVRKPFMAAIERGYLTAMGQTLNSFEKAHFYFAGEMLIYMQAIRFLTDYLSNDLYYGSRYPQQNLVRAKNQARLLELFQEAL